MARKTSENKVKIIIELFKNNMNIVDISKQVDVCVDTVSKILKEYGYKKQSMYNQFDDDDIKKIAELYLSSNWDEIYKLYPILNRSRVYNLMNMKGIRKDSYFWSNDEVNYLKDNFNILSINDLYNHYNGRHSRRAITTKAMKLNLTENQKWSEDEEKILIDNYSIVSKEDMLKLLPKRTWFAILCHAQKFNIRSYHHINEKYSDYEKEFIKNNFGIFTDEEIANKLNKSIHGIKDQRYRMNLYYEDTNYGNYKTIPLLFRGQIWEWKRLSMEKCNYKCIFTGSTDFDIHHIFGFNIITGITFDKLSEDGILKDDCLDSYSKDELDYMIDVFKDIHSQYPIGVCVRKDIHNLFHRIYGSGGNTENQWNNFVKRYNEHEFNECYYKYVYC